MARPKKDEAKKPFTVMLEPSVVEEIEKYANKIGLSKSHFARNLILMGLDDSKKFDSVGLLGAVVSGLKTIRALKKKLFMEDLKIFDD